MKFKEKEVPSKHPRKFKNIYSKIKKKKKEEPNATIITSEKIEQK
jgi:hypothetical protein